MQAIILAGGQATRLRPITHDLPKCLLEVGGKTLLSRQLDALRESGVRDIIIVTGFKAEAIRQHVQEKHPDLTVTFIHNDDFETTRAAHGLWVARKLLNDDLIYLNSDLLCDPRIIAQVVRSNNDSVTAIQRNKWDEEEVNVIVGKNLEIKEIGKLIPEKDSYGEFIGATKLTASFVRELVVALDEMVTKEDTQRFAVDAINMVIKKGAETLYALDVTALTATEIDTIEDYERAIKIWSAIEETK